MDPFFENLQWYVQNRPFWGKVRDVAFVLLLYALFGGITIPLFLHFAFGWWS